MALKPPRGFDFAISVAGHRLQAKNLEFAPIADIPNGIQVVTTSNIFENLPEGKQAEELAWLIVETGIGEALTGQLRHIEFANIQLTKERRPISELETYLGSLRHMTPN